jgi:hypothetical protein
MRAAESHADAEKEQRETTRYPFRKQRQKGLDPLILSHQHLFGTNVLHQTGRRTDKISFFSDKISKFGLLSL